MKKMEVIINSVDVGNWSTSFKLKDINNNFIDMNPESLIHNIGSLVGKELMQLRGLKLTVSVEDESELLNCTSCDKLLHTDCTISIKLISEVLKESHIETIFIGDRFTTIDFNVECKKTSRQINTHELSNKCKKWADCRGYQLVEYMNTIDIIQKEGYINVAKIVSKKNFDPLNIFKACQWILNNEN